MDGQQMDRRDVVCRWAWGLTLSLVVLGMGLRLRQYLSQQSYWHDEAMLVLNIFQKDASGLLGRLDSAQAAPPGFLLAQRGMYLLFGNSELAMRAIPLACSLIAMALFAGLAWRFFKPIDPRVTPFIVLLFACSERIIWHAAEAKQYSGDVMVALILLWTAWGLRESWTPTQRLLASAIVATCTIWISHASLFMFGGISLVLLPSILSERKRQGLGIWIGANAVFAVSFLAVYFISIRDQETNYLFQYWKAEFVDYERPLLIPLWFLRELASLCNYALDLGGPVLLPLAVLGAWGMYRAGRREGMAALVLPAAMVLFAAAVHRYPFGGSRLTVFLAPAVFLLAGVGVAALGPLLQKRVGAAWLVVPGYLVVLAGMYAASYLFTPESRGNIAPVVHYIASHWKPGDIVYANKVAEFKCYWTDAPLRPTTELDEEIPEGRFWLALSYVERHRERNVEPIENLVETEADRRDLYNVSGGTALLFEGLPDP